MELWRLLAHNHWLTLNILGYRLRLCARCSGYVLGFITSLLAQNSLNDPLGSLSLGTQQIACVVLTLPFILDWLTQTWGLRGSSNSLRLSTGILMGVAVYIFYKLVSNLQISWIVFIGAAIIVAFVGYVGKLVRSIQQNKI